MSPKDDEFSLINDIIRCHFQANREDVSLGIGDDCALTRVESGVELAISTDTLVAGQHFFSHTSPFDIGYKTLAVNLSDLAAMGAAPAWATLNLTLPKPDTKWLTDFMAGFSSLAKAHQLQLIGGDLTKGPLCLSVQIIGKVPVGQAILRDGANVDDDIYVTGTLGGAGLGVLTLKGDEVKLSANDQALIEKKLHQPTPRVQIGERLKGIATACIDISDGLSADLSHILNQSKVGAIICQDRIPTDAVVQKALSTDKALEIALHSGDDYELCFTSAKKNQEKIQRISAKMDIAITPIGQITEALGLYIEGSNGTVSTCKVAGFSQF